MARPGVTYLEVAEAANHLVNQNKNPTIEQIRLILGTGSSTTIANHLREWKAQQNEEGLFAMSENLPQEFVALMKSLWQQVLNQASVKISTIQQESDQLINELKAEFEALKNEKAQLLKEHEQIKNKYEALDNEKKMLEKINAEQSQELVSMIAKHESLAIQLNEKQNYIDNLNKLHKQAQENLEHFREAAREQRLIDEEKHAQQKRELQSEIKTFKEQINTLRENAISTQQQYLTLQQAHTLLEEQHSKIMTQAEQQKIQLLEMEKIKNESIESSRHWQNQYKETQKALENKTIHFIEIQSETKLLSHQFNSIKNELNEALNQSKLLSHEKWTLAQEKAQLEGQLKQMQKMIQVLE